VRCVWRAGMCGLAQVASQRPRIVHCMLTDTDSRGVRW
jgi:hypothetical protein